jgi:excisionase family DNA binding protein
MGSMLTNPLATRQIVYMTIPEAAEYLRVSPRTVYHWLREGRLQRFRLGNVSRIEMAALDRFVAQFTENMEVLHVQLDELWANVKNGSQDMWLWVAHEASTKLIPVMQEGGRSQDLAYSVVHELKRRLAADCVPEFSTDGLKHDYYALTAHFGKWEWAGGKRPVWVLLRDYVYSQVIKHQRRRKTVEVERRVLVGEAAQYRERLWQAGLSGRINTAFVERLNLTIRQCISKLTRRTWGPARYTPELMEHLEWWRSYYHFVRPHESLAVEQSKPFPRKGRQLPRKYWRRTLAMAAGLTDHKWRVRELISYPLPRSRCYKRGKRYEYWVPYPTLRLDFGRAPSRLTDKRT